ncbi:MAG: hypothetical protein COT37_02435, partial [Parcubacteria group bacterium CG08_land_8_20_14_0_20_43_9]
MSAKTRTAVVLGGIAAVLMQYAILPLTAIARPRRPAKPMASATRIAPRTAPWQRTLIAVAWEGIIVV